MSITSSPTQSYPLSENLGVEAGENVFQSESQASRQAYWFARLRKTALSTIGIAGYIFLYLPILILVFFSFNTSSSVVDWDGFSLRWYGELLKDNQVILALWNSLFLAVVSTIISTVLGTLAALGMECYHFRSQALFEGLLYLPVIIPDIAMAIMLLLFFNISGIGFDPWRLEIFGVRLAIPYSVIIGHVAFNISFVAIVVRARLAHMDKTLEEAAQDLYANPWEAFRKVTLPMLLPGILGGALLAFTISLDDFVITFFTSGSGFNTLPVRVFAMIKKGITPKINAVSTVMLALSLILVITSLVMRKDDEDGTVEIGL